MQENSARLGITNKRKMVCSNCGIRFFGYKTTLCKKCLILRKLPRPTGRDATRELVRIRDNHTCRKCGKKWKKGERRLDVHHLKGQCGKKSKKYDRKNEIKNLITLCHRCHLRIVYKKIKL